MLDAEHTAVISMLVVTGSGVAVLCLGARKFCWHDLDNGERGLNTMTEEHMIDGVDVYAMGALRVELSDGKKVNAQRRAPLFARVDLESGRVELYVDKEGVQALQS